MHYVRGQNLVISVTIILQPFAKQIVEMETSLAQKHVTTEELILVTDVVQLVQLRLDGPALDQLQPHVSLFVDHQRLIPQKLVMTARTTEKVVLQDVLELLKVGNA